MQITYFMDSELILPIRALSCTLEHIKSQQRARTLRYNKSHALVDLL